MAVSTIKHGYIVETKTTATFNVPANSGQTGTLDVSKSGYKPIGIVGHNLYSWNTYASRLYIEQNNCLWSVRNITGSAVSNNYLTVFVLYQRA